MVDLQQKLGFLSTSNDPITNSRFVAKIENLKKNIFFTSNERSQIADSYEAGPGR